MIPGLIRWFWPRPAPKPQRTRTETVAQLGLSAHRGDRLILRVNGMPLVDAPITSMATMSTFTGEGAAVPVGSACDVELELLREVPL